AAAVRRMLGWYACRAGSATAAWDEVELPNIAAAADAAASCGEDDTARLLRGSVNQSGLPEALACFRYALSVAAPGPPPR
ncbi:MAG TPA: hypothetical protein VJT31_41325, partial [Rugosimonospora sp.]|nr:hypothetical protein [Rugosimonospora sp.]